MQKTYFVYILECSDKSYYTGVTNNIERRVQEHIQGLIPGCYTHSRRPVHCVFSQATQDINEAIAFEKQIKGWTRAKKKALIEANYSKLQSLSRRHGSTGSP